MGWTCCAVGSCVNNKNGKSKKQERGNELIYHRFPVKSPDLCQIWVSKCGDRGGEKKSKRPSVPNVYNSKICSDHFQASDYIRDLQHELLNLPPRRRLKPDAVPSLVLGHSSSSILPYSDISSSSAAEPERFKSHCFFCGYELSFEEQAGPGKQSTMYSKWADSCAGSVQKLFGLEGWFKNVFRSASYCDPCLELVREIDFSMKMFDKAQGQVDSCRKKSEELLRGNCHALTIKKEVHVEEDGDQVPSLNGCGTDPYEKAVVSVVEGLDKQARESEVDPSIVPVIVNISSRAPAPNSSNSVACQTEIFEILSNVPKTFMHLLSLPVPPKPRSSEPSAPLHVPVCLFKHKGVHEVPAECPKVKIPNAKRRPAKKNSASREPANVVETDGNIQELDLTSDPERVSPKRSSKRTLRKCSPRKIPKKRRTETPAKVKKNLIYSDGMSDDGDLTDDFETDDSIPHSEPVAKPSVSKTKPKRVKKGSKPRKDSIPHAETVTKPKPKRIRKRTKPRKGFGCTYLSCKNSTFFTENNLQNHIRFKHLQEPNPFHCHSCDEKFDCYEVYRDHVTANHMVPIKCSEPGCNYSCYSEPFLKMHMRRIHGIQVPLRKKCRYIPRPAPRSGRLFFASTSKCYLCLKAFPREQVEELQGHIKLHEARKDEGVPLSCVEAGCNESSFLETSALRKHVKAEHEYLPFKCSDCDLAYSSLMSLDNHRARGHGSAAPLFRLANSDPRTKKPGFLCTDCGKSYNLARLLREHMRIHTGERPFKCPYKNCGRSFINSTRLRDHEQYHSDERPFLCFKCAWAFKSNRNLRTHLANHKEREERRAKGESIRLDPQSGPRSRRKPKITQAESQQPDTNNG